MEIRHINEDDVPQVRTVAELTWRETYDDILSPETLETVISEWYDPALLREQSADPYFYVAEKDGEIVGFVHVTVDGTEAEMERIYVHPDHWRSGIGTALYDHALNALPDDVELLHVEVLSENVAGIEFYRSNGLERVADEDTLLEGEVVEQYVMEKEIE